MRIWKASFPLVPRATKTLDPRGDPPPVFPAKRQHALFPRSLPSPGSTVHPSSPPPPPLFADFLLRNSERKLTHGRRMKVKRTWLPRYKNKFPASESSRKMQVIGRFDYFVVFSISCRCGKHKRSQSTDTRDIAVRSRDIVRFASAR